MDFSFPPEVEAFRTEVKAFLAENFDESMLDVTHDGTMHVPSCMLRWRRKAGSPPRPERARRWWSHCARVDRAQRRNAARRAPIDAMGVTVITAAILMEHGSDHLKETVVPALLNERHSHRSATPSRSPALTSPRRHQGGQGRRRMGDQRSEDVDHDGPHRRLRDPVDPHRSRRPQAQGPHLLRALRPPGIEIQPVPTMATERSNATFYDDVRLSDDWRVGEVNGGWAVMKTALKYERGIAGGQFMSPPVIDAGIDWATNHERADGTRPIDDPAVRASDPGADRCRGMPRLRLSLRRPRQRRRNVRCRGVDDEAVRQRDVQAPLSGDPRHDGSRRPRDPRIARGSPWRTDRGGAATSPVTAIYGGTSEINRNMVAEGFLGLLGLAERPADRFSSSGDAGPSARCWAARARPRDRIRRCGCSPTG